MVTLKKYYYVVKIKNIERDWKMENIFDNLKELKTDMEDKGWSIESFLFHYKEVQYVVLVKLYDEQKEKKPQYALVKMEFVDENNNSITIPTNSRGFMNEFVSIATIRNFFGVEYQENIGRPAGYLLKGNKRLAQAIYQLKYLMENLIEKKSAWLVPLVEVMERMKIKYIVMI